MFNLEKKAKELLESLDKESYPEITKYLSDIVAGNYWKEDGDLSYFADYLCQMDEHLTLPPSIAKIIIEIYLKKIEDGDDLAMLNLGAQYYTGRIGEQNFEKAVKYYEMSAKLGNSQAQENLGYCYYYGRVGEPDYKKAFHYFIKGALDKRIVSLYKIGDMYKNGYYVEKDVREAFCIYKQCKELIKNSNDVQLEADINIRLADCFYNGVGTEKNLELALALYQEAERLYYPRIINGEFLYKKQYLRAIEMQQKIRDELQKNIPSYNWTSNNY